MKERVRNIAAAVLAGGENSRMSGRNKGFICISGEPIITRTVRLLGEIFEEIVLVTNSPQEYKAYKDMFYLAEDIIKGAGPLGGIHSALSATKKEAVFFVACDMPFLHNALISRLVRRFSKLDCDALVPRINSFIEPLHGIYKKSLRDKLELFLRTNTDYSVRNFLAALNVEYFDLADNASNRKVFKNLNTPDDLQKAIGVG